MNGKYFRKILILGLLFSGATLAEDYNYKMYSKKELEEKSKEELIEVVLEHQNKIISQRKYIAELGGFSEFRDSALSRVDIQIRDIERTTKLYISSSEESQQELIDAVKKSRNLLDIRDAFQGLRKYILNHKNDDYFNSVVRYFNSAINRFDRSCSEFTIDSRNAGPSGWGMGLEGYDKEKFKHQSPHLKIIFSDEKLTLTDFKILVE